MKVGIFKIIVCLLVMVVLAYFYAERGIITVNISNRTSKKLFLKVISKNEKGIQALNPESKNTIRCRFNDVIYLSVFYGKKIILPIEINKRVMKSLKPSFFFLPNNEYSVIIPEQAFEACGD